MDITDLEAERDRLRDEIKRLKQNNIDWVERCRNFRKNDNEEYEKELNKLRAERDDAMKLLKAVTIGSWCITCEDVDGKNWFDLRDALFARMEVKP